MKPLPGDYRHRLLITGDELRALKRHTPAMAEAFGLDRKIEKYKGTRPLTLYRWDLDCLLDVIDLALRDERDYPDRSAPAYRALQRLGERLRQEYDAVYGKEESVPLSRARKERGVRGRGRKKPVRRKAPGTRDTVYQFKITLKDARPRIWRRIQVKDCTLDKLHEHIQTAMGWTNSHLNHFKIGEQFYGDPLLMQENFDEFGYEDSTRTMLSDVLPGDGKRLRFEYQYDFGDSWWHEVLFEGRVRAEPGRRYPVCVEGERACPPEDVGGVWGYADFVQAIRDPEHEEHDGLLQWAGGEFDSEAFDLGTATTRMRRGLPDWRKWE
jgi:Plasmid pRiA4b ORF-3-like protein